MLPKAIVLLSIISCAFSIPTEGRIVNGTDAQLGDVPFIVSLRFMDYHSCGGSIVTARHIITAAHCVYIKEIKDLSVQYGLIQIVEASNAPNVIDVENYAVHEKFETFGAYDYDVAVVKLKSSISFSTYILPVQLPHAFNDTPEYQPALLSGWGYSKDSGNVMTTLQKVEIEVYSDDDCERIHKETGPTNRFNHICAGVPEGGKGQCSGDSGGPLVVNNQLVGLVSWSVKPCGIKGYPGVFTKVSNVVVWVIEQLTEL